jgi:hypothetical protein
MTKDDAISYLRAMRKETEIDSRAQPPSARYATFYRLRNAHLQERVEALTLAIAALEKSNDGEAA